MSKKTYSIFGAGAAGLYSAWRLLNGEVSNKKFQSKQLVKGDVLELYDWGKYNFTKKDSGSREPGARICTWFHKNDKNNSYLELGGMRYSYWNQEPSPEYPNVNNGYVPGHRVVTKTIEMLGLDKYSIPFNVTSNQLFYLRSRNFYLNDITSNNPAPYNVNNFGATSTPDQAFATLENMAVKPKDEQKFLEKGFSRLEWCKLYNEGQIEKQLPDTSVFQKGDHLKDIGYWNMLYDQFGSEGYDYAADGNGYSSNVINTNTAVSMNINDEFTPGSQYRTLSIGYSGMFNALFEQIVKLCREKGIEFRYYPDTRLHSILWKNKKAVFTYASRKNPNIAEGTREADAAWLAMPRASIDMVAQATRFSKPAKGEIDVLNHDKVNLYLEAAIMQPSYKVGMFFDQEWWSPEYTGNAATYPAQIIGYVITLPVIDKLAKGVVVDKKKVVIPDNVLRAMKQIMAAQKPTFPTYSSISELVSEIENITNELLLPLQIEAIESAAKSNTIGPSVTNSPMRMVVYFGNNAKDQNQKPVYGILASYDDEDNADFWRELEVGPNQNRKIPVSQDTQTLEGPRKVPARMVKMLRKMLGELHFGPNSNYLINVPEPIEAAYMDWSLPPFNAGYHEWAPHYNVGDVQQKIRKPSQLINGADADIFIVGEAYSNDQAWVEGAYCTAESVLNDFFGIKPVIDNKEYPFICPAK